MRLSDITPADIAPAFIPVSTVEFRGHNVDIYPLDAANILTLVTRHPAILNIWFSGEDAKARALVEALMSLDSNTINWALSIGLDMSEEDVRKWRMNAGEQFRILTVMIQASMPEAEKEKLKAELVKALTTTLGLAKLAEEQASNGQESSQQSNVNTAPASGNSRPAPSSPATSSSKPTNRPKT